MPRRGLRRYAALLQAQWRRLAGDGPGHCVACGAAVPAFLPYKGGWRRASPVLRALAVAGSDLDRFACPRCNASDRERHLVLYLDRLQLFDRQHPLQRTLHFAPESTLEARLAAATREQYVRGDLMPARADVARIDITEIPFPDAHFDLVVANHVLEHVPDDAAALREIARVLRRGGHALLQTPYAPTLAAAIESAAVTAPEARWLLFGQEDHVRLYGRDLLARIDGAGLRNAGGSHAELLGDVDARLHGVNPAEPLLLFVRD